ncbi:FAD-binding protein [Paraneptunicella aestuarii]|uniref:LamG-like jellyroll fold domain-containing protein n=1 Tax=Paraneptunicella aestuarii TaxID=2831148 RepID=UPI001E39DCFD|nr:LamG-like jellyroll fold domain-containing protein [Paraneptunicella aestuarii]UAA38177.1 FAD-binding protein [Paraneptunicella aestuarii]
MTQAVAFSPYAPTEQAVPNHFAKFDFSIECWLKLQGHGTLFQHNPAPNIAFSVSVSEEGNLSIHYRKRELNINLISVQGGINLARWTHTLIIKNQQSIQLFANGTPIVMREMPCHANNTNVNQQHPKQINNVIQGLLIGDNSIPNTLNGIIKELTVWNIALPEKDAKTHYEQTFCSCRKPNDISDPIFSSKSIQSAIPVAKLKHFISLTFDNQSNYSLQKTEQNQNSSSEWPQYIAPKESISINYEEVSYSHFVTRQAMYMAQQNPKVKFCITLTKSEHASQSLVRVTTSKYLSRNIQIQENTDTHLKAHVVIYNVSEHLTNEPLQPDLKSSKQNDRHEEISTINNAQMVNRDISQIDHVKFDPDTQIACIGAGGKISQITAKLAMHNVMIAHGIDANANITTSISAHHTGPWTRTRGMCTEHLIAAEVVLPDGSLETTSEIHSPQQYWAIKTQGHPQSGTVTQYYFKTFPMPAQLLKFELEWNPYTSYPLHLKGIPTLDVLSIWEQLIGASHIEQLTGSYLKINATSGATKHQFDYRSCVHNCQMHGYWQGSPMELEDFIENKWGAAGAKPDNINIQGIAGLGHNYQAELNHLWFRESVHNVCLEEIKHDKFNLPPDQNDPLLHQTVISFSSHKGLGQQGHKALLHSLNNEIAHETARQLGIFNYVTLEAIAGKHFKAKHSKKVNELTPYQRSLYALRFQASIPIQSHTSRNDITLTHTITQAQQWIDNCKQLHLPNTSKLFRARKNHYQQHNSNRNSLIT